MTCNKPNDLNVSDELKVWLKPETAARWYHSATPKKKKERGRSADRGAMIQTLDTTTQQKVVLTWGRPSAYLAIARVKTQPGSSIPGSQRHVTALLPRWPDHCDWFNSAGGSPRSARDCSMRAFCMAVWRRLTPSRITCSGWKVSWYVRSSMVMMTQCWNRSYRIPSPRGKVRRHWTISGNAWVISKRKSSSSWASTWCAGVAVPSTQTASPSDRAPQTSHIAGPSATAMFNSRWQRLRSGQFSNSRRWSSAALTARLPNPTTGLWAASGNSEFRASCASRTR